MRKWTYLVAALLMSGTAATFTSCIDTTEPAGIEEMRSAKADLLRQKAELQKALAEKQGIENQIAALNVELQQAINAWKMDSLKAKQDTLALSLETKLLEMQQLKAQADYNLQKALEQINVNLITMKDDIYLQKLSYYKALLVGGKYITEEGKESTNSFTGAVTDLHIEQNDLLELQLAQIAFEAKKPTFKPRLEAKKAKEEAELAINQSFLKTVEDLKAASTNDEAANNQLLADAMNALKALDKEESEKIEAINEAIAALKPTANEIAVEKEKLNKLEIYTITKTDALTKIGNQLYYILSTYSSDIESGAFKETSQGSGEYELIGDINLKAKNVDDRLTAINNIKGDIKDSYSDAYKTAYNNLYPSAISSASDLLNEDGSIKEEYSSKIENEYERLKIDAEQVEEAYKEDEKAWLDAYKAYMAALYDYNNYINGKNYYDETEKEIKEYNAADAAEKTLEEANRIRVLVRTYIEKREKVDGAVSTGTGSFYDNYKDALTDANKSAFDTYMTNYQTNSLLFGSSFNEKISTGKSNNDNCLLNKFIDATNKFLGSIADELAECKEPKTVVNGTETTYVVPEGLEPDGTSNFKTYLENLETLSAIDNIDTWVAVYQQLDKDYNALYAFKEETNGNITATLNEQLEQLEALWKLEVEAYLIKGNSNVWKSAENPSDGIEDNPYKSIYDNGMSGIQTKYDVINGEITALKSLIGGDKYISFVYYDYTTSSYVVVKISDQKTVDKAIEEIKVQIEAKKDDIAETTALIAMFDKYGFIDDDITEEPSTTNCGEALANEIAEQEKVVNEKVAEVARIEAIIEKLTTAAAQ